MKEMKEMQKMKKLKGMKEMQKMKENKKKYKVMGDTKDNFLGIEFDLVIENDDIGNVINVLGGTFTITQNGQILVLSEPKWVLTLQDITPVPVLEKPKLVINETVEIFFGDKTIEVKIDTTYEELFYFLQKEWKLIKNVLTDTILPFDYSERLQLFTFKNDWGFKLGKTFSHMSGGSFAQLNAAGRNK